MDPITQDAVAHSTLSRIMVYATVISGFVAAYLTYRRGESLVAIARRTVTNPVGFLSRSACLFVSWSAL